MDPAASDAVEGRQPDNKRLKRIAVFCGASFGSDPQYTDCAKALGQEMIKRKIGLVDLWLCLSSAYALHALGWQPVYQAYEQCTS